MARLLAPLQIAGLALSVFCCALIYGHALEEWQQLSAAQPAGASAFTLEQQVLVPGEVKTVRYGQRTFQEQQFRYGSHTAASARTAAASASALPTGTVSAATEKATGAGKTVVQDAFSRLLHAFCKGHRGGLLPQSVGPAPALNLS